MTGRSLQTARRTLLARDTVVKNEHGLLLNSAGLCLRDSRRNQLT